MSAHSPGWRHPCRVPCPGLPIPADLRPASHHSAASGGGTPTVNQRAVRGGTSKVNQRAAYGGIQDPVRGQSLVAGDAIPGRVVRWKMIAARMSRALKHATRRRETQWRDLSFLIVTNRGNSQLFADFLRQNVIYVVVEWDDSIQ